jgi:small-conductance mechanosensitive channel
MAEQGLTPAASAPRAPASAPIEEFDAWFSALIQPRSLIELGLIASCVATAWFLTWLLRRAWGSESTSLRDGSSILLGRRIIDGVLFPVLLLALAYAAKAALALAMPVVVFKVAIPVLVALAVIRVGVKVLQVAFRDAPIVRVFERTISWIAWLAMVLWVSGLLPVILAEMDAITWKVGSASMSLRTAIEGALTAVAVLIFVLWISAAIEARLLRKATGNDLSLRKAVSNAMRALLLFVGLLVGMSAVGIDLTALSVLGGAVGVGIGFGLQKLAASYVSGFVMLAERSVRIGDNVGIDGFEGRITEINARYTVIRALSGRESIVPNEMFISNRIENLSLSDTQVLQSTLVSVAYDSDVELVMRLLREAAESEDRVQKDPGPGVNLTSFGADGLEFTLNYWILDPENGQQNLRSKINLAILKALRTHGVEIPYPQRVIHTRMDGPRPAPADSSAAANPAISKTAQ